MSQPIPLADRLQYLRRLLGRLGPGRALAIALVLALLAGAVAMLAARPDTKRATAYFPRTVGIYPGSDVRVLGVRVGEVARIVPEGERVRVELELPEDRKIPAEAKAAIINSSVVSDRYVQLLPVYRGGPTMPDGAVIPQERTAVPVELDRVYDSLHTTSEALGPKGANKDGSLSRLLEVSSGTLDGQGKPLHRTVADLSDAVSTLSSGRKDLFGTVRNLQKFTAALAADDDAVRDFNDSLRTVARQLAGERKDLTRAIRYLSAALTDVSGFVKANKGALTKDVKGLSEVTKVLVKQRAALAEVLDVGPAGLGNLQNAYNPSAGTLDVRDNPLQPQDPAALICSLLRTADEDTDCGALRELLGPVPEIDPGALGGGLPAAGSSPVGAAPDRSLGGILEVSS